MTDVKNITDDVHDLVEMEESNPYRVLIVDDNVVNVKVIDIRLKKKGVVTTCLTDSTKAIEFIKENKYDLILLDVIMPEVSGLEILKWIRENYSAMSLPVIMATAKVENQDLIEAMKVGANDYITKPIDFQIAWARIETHITIKRFNDEVERKRTESLKAASMGILIDMAGSVAHEINNPLTIGIGRAQLLQMQLGKLDIADEKKKEKLHKDLDNIFVAMLRAEAVVSGLRAFAKDERDKAIGALNLKDVLMMALNVCRTTITATGIEIRGDQNISGDLKILGKESLLIQVFYNILKNAKEAISNTEGGWIEIICSGNEEETKVSIKDSGTGIDEDTVNKIFQPFFTTRVAGTPGMGLSNSKDIISEFGGKIEYSKASGNTEFIVSLPCKEEVKEEKAS